MTAETWKAPLERAHAASALTVPTSGRAANVADLGGLPSQGDSYQAASPPSPEPLTRICFILGREEFAPGGKPYRFFQYVHLDSGGWFGFTPKGQAFSLRFAGIEPVEVMISGRHLLKLCDDIQAHRIAWLRVVDRDMGDERVGLPVVTGVEIKELSQVAAGSGAID
jgi:hypothetical protein